jgi:hypothetical protein
MNVVTPDFVRRIIRSGPIADAQARARDGMANPKNQAQWDKFTSWGLICEEILDTEHGPDWYDDILAELTRRGFSHDQIDRMRGFAWQTAGWLNYDKILWEWVYLDEADIRTALDFQLNDGVITAAQHADRLSYIEHPSKIPAVI